mmetsp:Transcript_1726/g.6750  ORF Transcript_1726/g.6750 Transcript_1726/m.6750 type:complete len:290 (+) Transcript_1726:105-974(+)
MGRPDLAEQMFHRATKHRVNLQMVHSWQDQWQVPTLYMPGLKAKPYWDEPGELPLAEFLEMHFETFRQDFLAVMDKPAYQEAFTQNDHGLISAGSWGELKLYNGKQWMSVCDDVAWRSCSLLRARPELVGKFPTSRTHNVALPKEAGYFKLLPGTRLKPHTGPVNFHLYCHLGLSSPSGAWLRVGSSSARPRTWHAGRAMCFDDSFEHEAWHDGSEPRYVLMVTFWHPDLGEPEMPSDIAAPVVAAASAQVDSAGPSAERASAASDTHLMPERRHKRRRRKASGPKVGV